MNVFSKNASKCAYVLEALVTNGAKPNAKNNDNWTPLHLAARKGQIAGVKAAIKANSLLAERGMETFDLDAVGGVQQWTPLHLASNCGHFEVVVELITAGADVFKRNTTTVR